MNWEEQIARDGGYVVCVGWDSEKWVRLSDLPTWGDIDKRLHRLFSGPELKAAECYRRVLVNWIDGSDRDHMQLLLLVTVTPAGNVEISQAAMMDYTLTHDRGFLLPHPAGLLKVLECKNLIQTPLDLSLWLRTENKNTWKPM